MISDPKQLIVLRRGEDLDKHSPFLVKRFAANQISREEEAEEDEKRLSFGNGLFSVAPTSFVQIPPDEVKL